MDKQGRKKQVARSVQGLCNEQDRRAVNLLLQGDWKM